MKLKLLASMVTAATLAVAMNLAQAEIVTLPMLVENGKKAEALQQIAKGADVNTLRTDGSSALLYAAYQGDAELVKTLLDKGANPNQRNDYGAFPLSEAVQQGSQAVIDLLLAHKADPNLGGLEGETALMDAARSGNVKAAQALLKAGANVNAKEQWGGQSAVMWAAAQSQPEMLKVLIKAGAKVNEQGAVRLWDRRTLSEPRPKDMNKGGFTPLLYAARQGCTACIKILKDAGADLNATDPDRISSLNLALINLHFDTALALIDAGADVNQWDLFGRAPLFNAIDLNTLPTGGRPDIASEDKHTGYDVAKVLLEKGANPNMQLKVRPPYRNAIYDRGSDNPLSDGATPLLRAARAADNESVKLLLDHGALVDLANARGHTPLLAVAGIDWAAEPTRGRFKTQEASIETLKILLAHGANINALTGDPAKRPKTVISDPERGAGLQPAIRGAAITDGQNALHAAAKVGWTKIAQFLIDNGIKQEVKDTAGRTPFDLAMGRYPAAFLQPPPQPLVEMAKYLQETCLKTDGCKIEKPVDFSNPASIK
ncbi:MAG TPA: ankyrin repeat domain-containing protein [Candidatus Acidoferrum sp.]|nr:ankyrin repeat domain-containing protein [Candidatus Acidoferrum sp.]